MTGAYRLHLGDAVHYLDRVRLGIEHGAANTAGNDHYSSVAYYYEHDQSMLIQTDSLDIGDSGSEAAHDYTASSSQQTDALTSFFEGEDDDVALTDSGRTLTGQSSFSISIDPQNEGVLLRRRYDQFNACQQAKVLVDGSDVGTWYSPESNRTLRWAKEDFVLPPLATTGKSSVGITLEIQGEAPWTEYAYEVFSIVP